MVGQSITGTPMVLVSAATTGVLGSYSLETVPFLDILSFIIVFVDLKTDLKARTFNWDAMNVCR